MFLLFINCSLKVSVTKITIEIFKITFFNALKQCYFNRKKCYF